MTKPFLMNILKNGCLTAENYYELKRAGVYCRIGFNLITINSRLKVCDELQTLIIHE